MNRWLVVCFACVLLSFVATLRAADDDPVRVKLDKAKVTFQTDMDKYRSAVSASFDKREEAARKKGDKKLVDQIKAERQTFEEKGELPNTAPAAVKSQLSLARSSLEAAYKAAIRDYTRAKKDVEAAAVEKEYKELIKGIGVDAIASADPFQPKSVWVSDPPRRILSVMDRKDETFRARFQIGDIIEREVTGTFKDGKLSWRAKDVRAIKGDSGGHNYGTITTDMIGDKIEFVWQDDKGGSGTFMLRRSKGK